MAENQLWTAVFCAFVVWFAVTTFAVLRSGLLSSVLAKAFLWCTPALGLIAMTVLLYDAVYGEGGGFRGFAL